MKLQRLLRNKSVLYVVLFLAITNVVGYLAMGDLNSVIFFAAVAYLTTFFHKNMIVALGAAIVATNVLFAGNKMREGMKNAKKGKKGTKGKKDDEDKEGSKKDAVKASKKEKKNDGKKENYVQKNIRGSGPAPADESEEDEVIGKRVDYAATLEQAYDNLDSILGKDGIQNLTKETQDLMKQQKTLMESMKQVGPLVETAKTMMEAMNNSGMQQTAGKFTGMMDMLGGMNK